MALWRRIMAVMLILGIVAGCGQAETPDAAKLATDAATAFESVQTFHFVLDVTEGNSAPPNEIILLSAEGDTERPDKLQATLKARLGDVPIAANIIAIIIGQDAWITPNPFNPSEFEKQADTSGLSAFSPAKGVSDVLRGLRNAEYVAEEELEGVKVHRIKGVVDAAALGALTGGAATGGDVQIEAWIGVDDTIVRKLVGVGALDPVEEATITRTIVMSAFNEPVTISAPE